jgi:hypothetical protein
MLAVPAGLLIAAIAFAIIFKHGRLSLSSCYSICDVHHPGRATLTGSSVSGIDAKDGKQAFWRTSTGRQAGRNISILLAIGGIRRRITKQMMVSFRPVAHRNRGRRPFVP